MERLKIITAYEQPQHDCVCMCVVKFLAQINITLVTHSAG